MEKKLWGGRFAEETSEITERISASIHYDSRLYKNDIQGSIAHSKMLNKMNILSDAELEQIINGLKIIESDIDSGNFNFQTKLEDIHMNIESRLTEMIGDLGKKLHTARSRNDQVALDIRLYLRGEIILIKQLINDLTNRLIIVAEENLSVILPGLTHLQIAQPVRFSHHILAHCWALRRDFERISNSYVSADHMPLGVGALAGVNYENDRDFLRDELGFYDITDNSMDTVSDRDFALDFLYAAAMLGMHLSRFCEELIIWSNSEFSYIRLSDKVTTGSSIMPQKKNPDIAELIRGKCGRLYGNLISLLTVMKGLPLAYNRDMQEDKEPLFDSIDTIKLSLLGMIEMTHGMKINSAKMKASVYKNYSTATDIADYLSLKGIPFRTAHEISGSIVKHCEENSIDFFSLKVIDLKRFSNVFETDALDYLDPEKSTDRKVSKGSTSTDSVIKQIIKLKEIMNHA